MSFRLFILDRYILGQMLRTMGSVLAVVMSLMVLEHMPRLLEITHLSGQRGYIIAQTVAGLLPEYGGIGLLVGLFLGIALTIRRLALRGELDVIGACGIATSRWMRLPLTLTAAVSVLTIFNQGWLVPAGETKLMEIGRRMEEGEFGHRLQPGQFVNVGSGSVLLFEQVDAVNGELIGLFLRTEGNVFNARRGRFWRLASGAMVFELRDGQLVRERDASVLHFARFEYRTGAAGDAPRRQPKIGLLKHGDLRALWEDGTAPSRSAAYGRCLWAALILFVPRLALILGKPPRRQSGAAGILVGVIVLVLALKMITPLIDGLASEPEWLAAGILITWGMLVYALSGAEKLFGQGFVDRWVSQILQNFRWRNA